mgnify:CR=1 FL=1
MKEWRIEENKNGVSVQEEEFKHLLELHIICLIITNPIQLQCKDITSNIQDISINQWEIIITDISNQFHNIKSKLESYIIQVPATVKIHHMLLYKDHLKKIICWWAKEIIFPIIYVCQIKLIDTFKMVMITRMNRNPITEKEIVSTKK